MTKELAIQLRIDLTNAYVNLFDLLYLEMPDSRAAFLEDIKEMVEQNTPPLEIAASLNEVISARLAFLTTK